MIIETRYRDIPFEEAAKCATDEMLSQSSSAAWERSRGKPVRIYSGPVKETQWQYAKCGGPFYQVVGFNSMVCPHCAEIGD